MESPSQNSLKNRYKEKFLSEITRGNLWDKVRSRLLFPNSSQDCNFVKFHLLEGYIYLIQISKKKKNQPKTLIHV